MGDSKRMRPVFLVPMLVALLACPAGAASPGKSSHYPGEKCVKCHKARGKPEAKPSRGSAPAGGAAGETTGSPGGAAPSQGAPRR